MPTVERRPGRRRVTVVVAALVVLLVALGSGLFGGWVANRLDDDREQAAGRAGSGVPGAAGRSAADESRAAVIEAVSPSVVSIDTGAGTGSGVVLDRAGNLLTNYHVVATAETDRVDVVFSDGDRATAQVAGTDPAGDLAVLRVDRDGDLVPADFGDSDEVVPGDAVLALGNALGLEGSVTSGIISAKNRTIQVGEDLPDPTPGEQPTVTSIAGVLQTDAPINPGNSGGALVNNDGEVIGINTAIATSGLSSGNIGVGFAIPSNTAKETAEQLLAGEQVVHPYLGVSVGDARGGGALVQDVAEDSPAARAGLRPGDVITAANSEPVNDSDDLVAAVQDTPVGDDLVLDLNRDGEPLRRTATIGELED